MVLWFSTTLMVHSQCVCPPRWINVALCLCVWLCTWTSVCADLCKSTSLRTCVYLYSWIGFFFTQCLFMFSVSNGAWSHPLQITGSENDFSQSLTHNLGAMAHTQAKLPSWQSIQSKCRPYAPRELVDCLFYKCAHDALACNRICTSECFNVIFSGMELQFVGNLHI